MIGMAPGTAERPGDAEAELEGLLEQVDEAFIRGLRTARGGRSSRSVGRVRTAPPALPAARPAPAHPQLRRASPAPSGTGKVAAARRPPSRETERRLLDGALRQGYRSANYLTDLIFYARYPERRGTPLSPRDRHLVREWVEIRDVLVRPALSGLVVSSTVVPAVVPARPAVVVRTVPLSAADTRRAVSRNGELGRQLGWDVLYGAIASWILGLGDLTPTAETFAQSVAGWQWERGLSATGAIDYGTWRRMLVEAKAGIPAAYRSPEGVDRPHGLNAIVAAFGDPTQAGWEAQNIARVSAPAGRQFVTGVRSLQVHRTLAPQFGRVFTDLERQGLWSELVPTAGTYVCRTKQRYGKQPCGTPGVRFNQLSNHSWGTAIDIRPSDYLYYTREMQRSGRPLRYPPATLTSVFQRHGFHWGMWFMDGTLDSDGRISFANADPMHFQYATGY